MALAMIAERRTGSPACATSVATRQDGEPSSTASSPQPATYAQRLALRGAQEVPRWIHFDGRRHPVRASPSSVPVDLGHLSRHPLTGRTTIILDHPEMADSP